MRNEGYASTLWWAVPAAGFLALVALAVLFGGEPDRPGRGTSYDAGGGGFRAAYLLLDELGYPVFRQKRADGAAVRWVLFPTTVGPEAVSLDRWVRAGGVLLLADESAAFAREMGIPLEVTTDPADPGPEGAAGLGVDRLAAGPARVAWRGEAGEVLVEAGGRSAVTVYRRGAGEVWLLNRPGLAANARLNEADNAVLLCRLATEMLQRRPGRLGFDEYYHGLRDRPGVVELLLRPPVLWVTLQGAVLLGLMLWRYAPRFGAVRPDPPPARRSKEEFLDAVAALLERKGDYAAAYRAARDSLARELERDLGLPAGAPAEALAREAARRRPVDVPRLRRALDASALPARAGAAAFVAALNDLEAARADVFDRRPAP